MKTRRIVRMMMMMMMISPAKPHLGGRVYDDAPVKLGLGCYGSGVVSIR